MVVLTPQFASLLAFVASSSMLTTVNALPHRANAGNSNLPFPALVSRPSELGSRGLEALDLEWGVTSKMDDEDLVFSLPARVQHKRHEPPQHSTSTSRSRMHKRAHRHHGDHHHGHHRHHGHTSKVYADDPVIVNGNNNNIHTHTHKRSHRHHHHHHHGHHRYEGHHGTKVFSDDPLIVNGDNNHIHTHSHKKRSEDSADPSHGTREDSRLLQLWHAGAFQPLTNMLFDTAWHDVGLVARSRPQNKPWRLTTDKHHHGKRGLVDPLVPLLAPVPGIAGVISIVNLLSHAVLSDPLASLIISPNPGTMGVQSVDGEQLPGYPIDASNSSSTTMYLIPQDTPTNLGPSEKAVLISMPMLQTKDQSVKMYCASYDPNSASPSQLTSQPCVYNPNAGLDINSTSTHFSQLFSWNIQDGTISPLWLNQAAPALVDTTNAPGGASDPADVGGYMVGGAPVVNAQDAGEPAPKRFAMVFKAHPTASSQSSDPAEPTHSGTSNSTVESQSTTLVDNGDDSQEPTDGSPDDEDDDAVTGSSEGAQTSGDESTGTLDDTTPSAVPDQPTPSIPPQVNGMQASVVTSTFTMLVPPSASVADVMTTSDVDSTATPTPTL